jgi:WD40 repeat protein
LCLNFLIHYTLHVWDIKNHQKYKAVDLKQGYILELAFSSDGKTFITSTKTDEIFPVWNVTLWDAETGVQLNNIVGGPRLLFKLSIPGGIVWRSSISMEQILFSEDGMKLFVPASGRLWETDAYLEQSLHRVHVSVSTGDLLTRENDIDSIALSPDDQIMAIGSWWFISLLDLNSGKTTPLRPLEGNNSLYGVEFSDDGQVLMWYEYYGGESVDVSTGETLSRFRSRWIHDVKFIPGTKIVAISSEYNDYVELFDVVNGSTVGRIGTNSYRLAISPDGKLIAAGGAVWSYPNGQHLFDIQGDFPVFSPVGQILLTRFDQNIYFYNSSNGDLLRVLEQPYSIWDMVFNPKGWSIVSDDYKGNIYVWGIPR